MYHQIALRLHPAGVIYLTLRYTTLKDTYNRYSYLTLRYNTLKDTYNRYSLHILLITTSKDSFKAQTVILFNQGFCSVILFQVNKYGPAWTPIWNKVSSLEIQKLLIIKIILAFVISSLHFLNKCMCIENGINSMCLNLFEMVFIVNLRTSNHNDLKSTDQGAKIFF